jgi:sulfur dioxygenase
VRDLLGEGSGFKSVISEASGAKADVKVGDGGKVEFGGRHVSVRLTPGHTAGCASFVLDDESMVFTGDTLLIRGCGRTDFQGGSSENLFKSVKQQLFTLPEACVVYPGHDYKGMCSSSIAEEKMLNPRLGRGITEASFVKIMQDLKLATPKRLQEVLPKNMNCGV